MRSGSDGEVDVGSGSEVEVDGRVVAGDAVGIDVDSGATDGWAEQPEMSKVAQIRIRWTRCFADIIPSRMESGRRSIGSRDIIFIISELT